MNTQNEKAANSKIDLHRSRYSYWETQKDSLEVTQRSRSLVKTLGLVAS
ncbi:hypothetical protein [Halomicronema sp. CCY15110]|nr:hypothetical protein [Halomicronema sp. CCY15110]